MKGKLTVTLVYSYETETDQYRRQARGTDLSPEGMAEQDLAPQPSIVLDSPEWAVAGATFTPDRSS